MGKITQDDLDEINKKPRFSREDLLKSILCDAQIEDDYIDEAVESIMALFKDKENK